MLWDDETTRSVVEDPGGLLSTLSPGAIHVAMGSLSPECSEKLQQLHVSRGQRYLAAPVFGRPEAAALAGLNIMCAGDRDTFDRAKPVLSTMGNARWVGLHPGQANLMKVVGNNMIFASIQLLGEMFALLRKAGVSEEDAQAVIVDQLFPCPIFSGYSRRIRERQWSPPAGDFTLAKKDNGICLRTATALGTQLPLLSFMADRIDMVVAKGDGDLDISAFAKSVFEDVGLDATRRH
jgi:3-hydroxyisobutyrate dehydrogenase-like beta-hydroxyacid dehydrogenase